MTKQRQADLPAWVSIKATATYLSMSEKSVRRLIATGKLKAHRIGPRLIRVDRESLLALGRPIGGAA